jgi:hypothetical protein
MSAKRAVPDSGHKYTPPTKKRLQRTRPDDDWILCTNTCKTFKPRDSFQLTKRKGTLPFKSACIECLRAAGSAKSRAKGRIVWQIATISTDGLRRSCCRCQLEQPVCNFTKVAREMLRGNSGYNAMCKDCDKIKQAPERIQKALSPLPTTRKCSYYSCLKKGILQPISAFHQGQARCIPCNIASNLVRCSHGKLPGYCRRDNCKGTRLCNNLQCNAGVITKKYAGYCLTCVEIFCPDIPRTINRRVQERAVVAYLESTLPNIAWYKNIKLPCASSRFRADMATFLSQWGVTVNELINWWIINEIDESGHSDRNNAAEKSRMQAIWHDGGDLPMVFLRFNPDAYKKRDGTIVSACFELDNNNMRYVPPEQTVEWNYRLRVLSDRVLHWAENIPSAGITYEYLFYDE